MTPCNPAGSPVAVVPEFGAQTVMLIVVFVLLAQKICGVSILRAAAEAELLAKGLTENLGPIPALLPRINPEADRQANRIRIVLIVIVRFIVSSLMVLRHLLSSGLIPSLQHPALRYVLVV